MTTTEGKPVVDAVAPDCEPPDVELQPEAPIAVTASLRFSVYGNVVAIVPEAFDEKDELGQRALVAEACERVFRNAIRTHEALIEKGERGLNWSTFQLHYTAPDLKDSNTLIGWRAAGR